MPPPAAEAGELNRAETTTRQPGFRVLKIAPTPFFADYGCHVRIYEEAQALTRLGSKVTICTYPDGRNLDGMHIVRSPGLPGGRVRIGSSRHKYYLDAMLSVAGLRTALQIKPDIIHGHLHEGALIGLAIGRTNRRPLVFDFQGSLTAEMVDHGFLRSGSWSYRPFRWMERTINHQADAIITSSRPAADLLIREFGCPARKIFPVPDGVDVEVFRPLAAYSDAERYRIRTALGVPPQRRVVVYLGLLAEYQGSTHLLHAAKSVIAEDPEVHFLLMGYPGEDRYRELARSLGIEHWVTFTGRVPYERAPRYLAAGDVAVAPKLSLTEANGKLLNYMALGLPTVAFESPVNRDILGSAGVYATPGDAGDLARKLREVLADETAAASRGRALRRRAEEHFSWSQVAQTIVSVYHSLIGR